MEEMGLFMAGLIGGMVNSIAGGGSFITFPALLAAGVPPIAANATNTFASCAGYLSGAAAFRHALWTQRSQLPRLALLAITGGGFGAWLLLQTPPATFSRAIPWLLLLATVLLIWGEALCAWLRRLFGARLTFSWLGWTLLVLLFWLICAYGGFFNAGLGIILLGYLTLAGYEDIHLMNGLKLLVSALVAVMAIIVFGAGEVIAWREGSFVTIGTLVGGYGAARGAQVLGKMLVRRMIILVAAGMTVTFFIGV